MIKIFAPISVFLLSYPVLAHSVGVASVPFEVVDNRIVLDVILNSTGPFKMILDSNSSSLTVSPDTATKLKLPLSNPTPCGGAGSRKRTCYDTKLTSATVSGLMTQASDAAVVPIDTVIQVTGLANLSGVLGVQFFQEHVLQFDNEHNVLKIFPKDADLSKIGTVISLSSDKDYPSFLAIDGVLDGHDGTFSIDTGDRSNLTIFKPFVDSSHFKDAYSQSISMVTGQGINGPIHADVLRLKEFKVGRAKFEGFPVRLPDPKDFSSDKMAGSIGNGLLRAYNFVFDYPHKRLILIKRIDDRYKEFDRSGLWISFDNKEFSIADVLPNSPAARANLNLGDVIVSVDGQQISTMTLTSLRERLRSPNAKIVKMAIRRAGKVSMHTIRLADLI